MTLASFVSRLRRALRKPPGYVAHRLAAEARRELDRFTQPRFGRRFGPDALLTRTGAPDIGSLWERLLTSPGWPFAPAPAAYESCCPGDAARILEAAERAVRHEIDLLGSGPVRLGQAIDWSRDYRTGDRWPAGYFRGIDYVNRGRPSDVKMAWELSRVQWLLPCGQAYALTGDERFARAARDILEQWIEANPYACSVNWCVTMEPALRIFSWCALLRLCGRSEAWKPAGFRAKLLTALYLHALFTERFIERADVNGNHFTADAAALVLAGALFIDGADAGRWFDSGMRDLEREILLQVHPDGVDFEASTAYHRLVAELFLAASMAATACGRPASSAYRARLAAMARFTAAYMRPDATAPLWGDHDDARTLPMGPKALRDHRYLVGLIALHLGDRPLARLAGGSRAEACWWFGAAKAATLPEAGEPPPSQAFPDGGVYVIRDGNDHVFIDCGPVGLAGRGGHGHNDLLSFEAVLDGVALVTEAGCYVYTADFDSRNYDRSTYAHNTPQVDGAEINRFAAPDQLWILIPDGGDGRAEFTALGTRVVFRGRHAGYGRLPGEVAVRREIVYQRDPTRLAVTDVIEGAGRHAVVVPLHLAPGVVFVARGEHHLQLALAGRSFRVEWSGTPWRVTVGEGRVATSYGVAAAGPLLEWRADGPLPLELRVCIVGLAGAAAPAGSPP